MKTKYLLLLILAFSFSGCKKGKRNPDSCNGKNTRREVKLAIDDLASLINTTPIITTVDSIGSFSVPEIDKESTRQDVEKLVFSITAKVDKVKKHRDGDWKVKLTDGNDKFLNCEVPNLYCSYAEASPYYLQFYRVREWIELNKEDMEGKMVRITGVAFADIDHNYPRNAADNNIELHPILTIEFL